MSTSNGSAASSFIIVQGSDICLPDASLPDRLSSGVVTGSQVIDAAESRVRQFTHGYALPEGIRSSALRRFGVSDFERFQEEEIEKDVVAKKVEEYVSAIADELEDDPLVLSILDGRELRLYLEDEDDFAMLAENLFTELDTEDTGKIKRSSMSKSLDHLGVDMGVPPASDFSQVNDILAKHGADGDDELGQAQFAQVLQSILQEVADSLAENPVVTNTNLKIFNGSKIRKILCNEKQLTDIAEKMLAANPEGLGSLESARKFLETNGAEFGVPPLDIDETTSLYDAVFAAVGITLKSDPKKGKENFSETVKDILEKFAEQLQVDPLLLPREN
ncbi:hypothetical protein MLD38_038677 [Melastoma candidum]|uniref:Uncharacterized protein n=1 Tax=Melastoma candidum TaxID=119954 RepID=A0ACB9KZN7_9MYRT|nr:hypothetical protein MLD38_038677 [Melastoma candidum]